MDVVNFWVAYFSVTHFSNPLKVKEEGEVEKKELSIVGPPLFIKMRHKPETRLIGGERNKIECGGESWMAKSVQRED